MQGGMLPWDSCKALHTHWQVTCVFIDVHIDAYLQPVLL